MCKDSVACDATSLRRLRRSRSEERELLHVRVELAAQLAEAVSSLHGNDVRGVGWGLPSCLCSDQAAVGGTR